ncbi:MAG: sodium ABC transporter ATP-binding protein [Rhodothermaceae bacterium]|nr:MAG: sodium ABC transporter ATP-binding protein [Rhodothermaceae bacterium]
MIRTERLRKVFGKGKKGARVALEDLNLRCDDGQVYALLGPNGAGKTTALRILATLLEPTSGDAFIDAYSVRTHRREIRRLLGVVSYETSVYERMTPREIGFFFGRMNDLPDAEIRRNLDYIFGLLRMEAFVDRRTETFSTGMKQKTVIMRALVTNPKILLFDEPTAGLDLLTAKRVMDYIRLLRGEGKTILFSTHILWEAEKLADTIGVIHRGRLVAEGSLETLRAQTGHTDIEDVFFSLVEEDPA